LGRIWRLLRITRSGGRRDVDDDRYARGIEHKEESIRPWSTARRRTRGSTSKDGRTHDLSSITASG
jgi:hypothetical protein